MKTESILLVLFLEATTHIVNCDVIQDGNEFSNKDDTFLHKIVGKDLKSLIENKNFHYPIVFSSSPHQTIPVLDINNLVLNHISQLGEYNLFYSVPIHGELSTSNILPITPYNIFDFSNTFKDPYENSNQILRDNNLDYFYSQPISNAIEYSSPSTSGYQGSVYGGPLNYLLPYQVTTDVSDFNTRPFSKFPDDLRSDSELKYHQNIPFDHTNRKPNVSPHPQQYPQPGPTVTPPSKATTKHPQQSQKYKSPNVEIVKAIGYELPVKSSTHQPVSMTRSYIFDSDSTPLNLHNTEKQKQPARNEWKGILNDGPELTENTFSEPIIVIDEEDGQQSNKLSLNQYFLSNRKPITFENQPEPVFQNVTELASELIVRKNGPSTSEFENSPNNKATTNKSVVFHRNATTTSIKSDLNTTKTTTKNYLITNIA